MPKKNDWITDDLRELGKRIAPKIDAAVDYLTGHKGTKEEAALAAAEDMKKECDK